MFYELHYTANGNYSEIQASLHYLQNYSAILLQRCSDVSFYVQLHRVGFKERRSTSILCALRILPFDCGSHFHMTSYVEQCSAKRDRKGCWLTGIL